MEIEKETAKVEDVKTEEPKTIAEFEAKLSSDPVFADAFLKDPEMLDRIQAKANAPVETVVPPVEPPPVTAPVVETPVLEFDMGDGNFVKFNSVQEAALALRERDVALRNQTTLLSSAKTKEQELNEKIAEYENRIKAIEGKTADAKAEEVDIDPFDVEYHKKLSAKVSKVDALEEKLTKLITDMEKRETSDRTEREKLQQKIDSDRLIREQMTEANTFMTETPEFKTNKTAETLNREYAEFVSKVGSVLGTNGTMEANLQALGKFISQTPEGQAVREKAAATGVVMSDDINRFMQFLTVVNERDRLISQGKLGAKSNLKETYNYLKATNGITIPANNKGSAEDVKEISDRAKALEAAEALKARVATDTGSIASQQSVEAMDDNAKLQLLNTPIEELQRNPVKLKLFKELYKSLGIPAPVNV